MANRRMFSRQIARSDAFLDMPLSTQALYFQIGLDCDDDGICQSAKSVMRLVGANQNDLDVLVAKKFLIPFPNGVYVVKHWKINNYIQSDRYKPSAFKEVRELLNVKENRSYTTDKAQGKPLCLLNGYTADTVDTQYSIGKDSREVEKYSTEVDEYKYLDNSLCSSYVSVNDDRSKSKSNEVSTNLNSGISEELQKAIDEQRAKMSARDEGRFK